MKNECPHSWTRAGRQLYKKDVGIRFDIVKGKIALFID